LKKQAAFSFATVEDMIGIKIIQTGVCQPIPRHREIKDHLARHIIKKINALIEPSNPPSVCPQRANRR